MTAASTGTTADSPEAVLQRFAANFHSQDAAAQAALFRPDAVFLGSSVPEMLHGPEGALGYFRTAWTKAAPGVMTCDPVVLRRVTEEIATFSAICRLVRPERSSMLRASGTLTRDAEGWRFAELHVSAMPAPRG